ncbi:gluconokinase [Glutamicibacter uratoxydans]|uniref:Gluconokinase n=1 Tax=Glutamicibacter uratoxydans TaxID=43667 RepID=A0A4Y4DHW0_GLUUR|nr:gluconokinase [Glutamicibacter uratoxydans]GED04829.1 gluconokinase [Glutamicibacter uratoxydans]
MTEQIPPIVVMGVSGSGKSTIGDLLAKGLHREFVDGDSLHPQSNRDKMASGHALNDEDRAPWLEKIGRTLADSARQGRPIVLACSALKRSYRDLIRAHEPAALFVHLAGGKSLIGERMAARSHEFMPPSLLTSQLATLEEPGSDEHVLTADISQTPEQIVQSLMDALLPKSN